MNDIQVVRRLRRLTGASLLECFRAIAECSGDEARAIEWLRRNLRCGEHRREEER